MSDFTKREPQYYPTIIGHEFRDSNGHERPQQGLRE